MYLPRNLISHLYQHLRRTHHSLSPPILILVALEPDALCACRILTALLKRDYIHHKIQPVSGYGDLAHVGESLVQPMRTQQGGSGGVVVCLGVGGLVDLSTVLGLDLVEEGEDPSGGVEVWLIDARRPWNLGNVFGGNPADMALGDLSGNARSRTSEVENGRIQPTYKPGQGGIIVYDDGDIDEDLSAERNAYCALAQMPNIEDDGDESDGSDADSDVVESIEGRPAKKRKSWSDRDEENDESEDENGRPRQRRRSNSV
jgi:cell division control protein 45